MVIVARARTLPSTEADALLALCAEISRQAYSNHIVCLQDDPLLSWFDISTANRIRTLEVAVRKLLLGEMVITQQGVNFERISSISATFYVALFNVLNHISKSLKTSNPTWLRKPDQEERKICIDSDQIIRLFQIEIQNISKAVAERVNKSLFTPGRVTLRAADSTEKLCISDIDLVLTSPPYCTRIDYTSATSLQLAVLYPLNNMRIDHLSRRMVGSIRVPTEEITTSPNWGVKCLEFLGQVYDHPSKASNGYYYKTHIDYYNKMYKSLKNISAAIKPGGLAILVAQDSYYKEIHNDVPTIIAQFADTIGLALERKDDFAVKRSMLGIHRHSKTYRQRHSTIESVICLRKSI
ncbi:hypothetical protein [Methylobacterium sp. E-045]|uniref:hypothetical protein n=1 Tax=Methylobacterium sp. E-045 TaxID=2836575 RepID=UPI001FBB4E75|nr:hypothetical protein [Methylobacterium sp. E-045]MCJ2129409.1 hypothetical protein [Methylobacterium sp. E-045]